MKRLISKIFYSITLPLVAFSVSVSAHAGGDLVSWSYPALWNGYYAGVHVGYGVADYDGLYDGGEGPLDVAYASNLDLNGALGGLHIGYNWQQAMFVYGLEADITATSIGDTARDEDATTLDSIQGEIDFLGSVRARLGIVQDSTLIYATAGIAYADASYTAIDNGGASVGKVSFDDVGYVLGGGIERILTNSGMRFRIEGLYYKFDETVSTSTLNVDSDNGDFVSFNDIWSIRAGLSVPFHSGEHHSYK